MSPATATASATTAKAGDVSVVLCAYTEERWSDLVGAVESIRAQQALPREILVVIDNNPMMLARVREELSDTIVLGNDGVRGAGAARNLGVSAATGRIVAFLDDDATASPGWIEHALEAFEDPDVLGVGGEISPRWEAAPPRWMAREFYWTIGCTYPGLPISPAPVRNLIAANMFVRRDAFLELGGFRPGFGKTGARSGTEETELCIRAAQRWPQGRWLHDPRVAVHHRVPRTRSSPTYFLRRCYDEGIAKASVVRFVGGRDGLAAERTYTRRTLPLGFVAGMRATVTGGDITGAARSASIVVGLSATVLGYAVGRVGSRRDGAHGGPRPS